MKDSDIKKYLILDEWENKTGSYAIQGYASTFVRFLSGSYTGAVVAIRQPYNILSENKIL